MGKIDRIYASLPVPLQHAAVSTYGAYWYWLRYGPGFRRARDDYRQRESFSTEQWRRWQRERLSEILEAAVHTPYYGGAWKAGERRAALAGDLSALPFLDKAAARAYPDELCDSRGARRERVHTFHTSGTTGTPVATRLTTSELRDTQAVREARSARWAGVSFSLPRATFSGRMAVPDPESRGPFYRYNLVEKQVYLSPFHLRRETAGRYVEALRRHRIQWLTGYAVSYYLLARFILEDGHTPGPLKAVVTTSEKVTAGMRDVMERAYGCRVFEDYSTVENALFACQCELGSLHVSPDVSIVEILRPNGDPCEPGEDGEVISTCLMRRYQPLIRYRLGDRAAWSGQPCECGREMPVLREIVGRIEDVVIGPDGRQMVRFHGIFVDQPHVAEGQIVQEALDRVRVRVVPTDGFGPEDVNDIVRRMKQRLGSNVSIEVETMTAIPRTASGKLQPVVSLLSREHFAVERTGVE